MASVVFLGGFAVLREFDTLFTLPATPVGSHGLVLEIARDVVVVGFDHDGFAGYPRNAGQSGIGQVL